MPQLWKAVRISTTGAWVRQRAIGLRPPDEENDGELSSVLQDRERKIHHLEALGAEVGCELPTTSLASMEAS